MISLRHLLRSDEGRPHVELRSVAASTVAAVEGVVDHDEVLSWYAEAIAELDAAVSGLPSLGPPGGRYASELFTGGRGAVLVYRPVADPPARGRVTPVVLPPAELAVTVHLGPHDDIDVTYGRLGAWVVEHALAVDGPVHETYLVGPRDDPDPASWRTEGRLARIPPGRRMTPRSNRHRSERIRRPFSRVGRLVQVAHALSGKPLVIEARVPLVMERRKPVRRP